MAYTLSEKHAWNPFSDRRPCELDSPPVTASARDEPSDVPLGLLLTATTALLLAITLPWLFTRAIKCFVCWGLKRLFGRSGRSPRASRDNQDKNRIFHSPPTPPPNNWLRDTDVVDPVFNTPAPEPLLFSLSPPVVLGNGAAALSRQRPFPANLPTMRSVADQARKYPADTRGLLGISAASPNADSRDDLTWGGGGSSGWNPNLLSRQAALLPAISSVEGLMATVEFQEHIRRTRRRSPFLEGEQSQARAQVYKNLRKFDPDSFRRLLSRDDVHSYEVRPPPLAIALLDYLVVVGVPLAVALWTLHWSELASGGNLIKYGPLFIWLAVWLRLASVGHVSVLGRWLGIYLVYDMPDGEEAANAWEGLAGMGGHVLLVLFELMMAGLSCGVLALGTLLSIAAGRRRQTLAMRLLGLRLEQELCRLNRLSPFSPTCDNTASLHSRASSPRSPGSLQRRYGLSHRL